jgi:hypothetical protein
MIGDDLAVESSRSELVLRDGEVCLKLLEKISKLLTVPRNSSAAFQSYYFKLWGQFSIAFRLQ